MSGQLSSGEALLTGFGAAATVADAVSACTVPRHPNEQRPVVAIVRRYVLSARVPLFPGSYINFVKLATYRAIASRCADFLPAVASLPPSPPSALIWIKGRIRVSAPGRPTGTEGPLSVVRSGSRLVPATKV